MKISRALVDLVILAGGGTLGYFTQRFLSQPGTHAKAIGTSFMSGEPKAIALSSYNNMCHRLEKHCATITAADETTISALLSKEVPTVCGAHYDTVNENACLTGTQEAFGVATQYCNDFDSAAKVAIWGGVIGVLVALLVCYAIHVIQEKPKRGKSGIHEGTPLVPVILQH